MNKNIFIGGAWPYANNSMHVGHLAALLPGDVLARFFRKNGDNVLYVSGSDCHGTPITIRSQKMGVSPKNISLHYHNEFVKNFCDLSFTYDFYTNTMTEYHANYVQNVLKKIEKNGYFFQKTEEEDFCEHCNKFVSDREIKGVCPICGSEADGDQCDKCLTALTPEMLKDKKCKVCGNNTITKENTNIYFKLSALTDKVQQYFEKYNHTWRQTAINETEKYLNEGLKDRAITRSLDWGIKVPFAGFDDKRIYVWIEAVLGYMSAGDYISKEKGVDFNDFITNPSTIPYYVHGKDNIVFHTVILPALLEAIDPNIQKPKMIISSEYINLNNEKMSKSKGNLVTVNTLLSNFDSDSIRYYFVFNNPEKKDGTFSFDEFILVHNKHLVGGLGNFVNRNLAFLEKKFEGKLPKINLDEDIKAEVSKAYLEVGECFEKGELKLAAQKLYDLVQFANKYYDQSTPWILAKTDKEKFDNIVSNCLYLIVNLANLYEPILPKRAKIVKEMLGAGSHNEWKEVLYDESVILKNVEVLFNRVDIDNVDLTLNSEDTFLTENKE